MSNAQRKEETYTLADALTWDEGERIEIIEGEPVMHAAPVPQHQRAVSEFDRQLGNYLLDKKCNVYPAPFAVRLFEKKEDRPENVTTMVEPDVSVVCDDAKIDESGCKGAPDFIAEILSPSTQRHDRLTKLNLYERAGVREYWIVDLAGRVVQKYMLEEGRFVLKEIGLPDDKLKVGILEDCEIELSLIFPAESGK